MPRRRCGQIVPKGYKKSYLASDMCQSSKSTTLKDVFFITSYHQTHNIWESLQTTTRQMWTMWRRVSDSAYTYPHSRNIELCLDFILLLNTRQWRQSHADKKNVVELQNSYTKMINLLRFHVPLDTKTYVGHFWSVFPIQSLSMVMENIT